jgi:hypothetical protein
MTGVIQHRGTRARRAPQLELEEAATRSSRAADAAEIPRFATRPENDRDAERLHLAPSFHTQRV